MRKILTLMMVLIISISIIAATTISEKQQKSEIEDVETKKIETLGNESKKIVIDLTEVNRNAIKLRVEEEKLEQTDEKTVEEIKEEVKEDIKTAFFQTGVASYYGGKWHGRKTANGEIFDTNTLTAAHKTLPFNTKVKVTNVNNGKSVIVRINNRGPYSKGRVIDLSQAAFKKIENLGKGITKINLEIVK